MKAANGYSISMTLPLSIAAAEQQVRQALAAQKFGVITEIDIQATLKQKLGVTHAPHKILGACNPQIAHAALEENEDIALALPCNIVLLEKAVGITTVSAMLPSVALQPFRGLEVQRAACTAEEALHAVFAGLSLLYSPHHAKV